jgi:hypothetical protein
MDSPSQGAKDIPTESVTLINDSVIVDVKVVNGSFDWYLLIGRLFEIIGKWNQGGQSFDLTINKVEKATTLEQTAGTQRTASI